MARMKKSQRKAIWIERVGAWRRSGQSVAEFCRRRKLSVSSLYQWRKRLAAPTTVSVRPKAAARFVEVNVIPEGPSPWWCEVELRNGRKLRVRQGMGAEQMAFLAAALEGGPC